MLLLVQKKLSVPLLIETDKWTYTQKRKRKGLWIIFLQKLVSFLRDRYLINNYQNGCWEVKSLSPWGTSPK